MPGPIPPYTNPPIEPQYFQPSLFFITAITLGKTTLVTTSVNHNYVIGQNTRLIIPQPYGCFELNGQEGYVISIPNTNQVVLDIYSTLFNPYIASPNLTNQNMTPPQIKAIGEINSGPTNTSGIVNQITYIPGSFTNISPI